MSHPTDAHITHCTGSFDRRTDAELVIVHFKGEHYVALWSGGDDLRKVASAGSASFAIRRAKGIAKLRKMERRLDWWAGSARLSGPGYSGWLAPRP